MPALAVFMLLGQLVGRLQGNKGSWLLEVIALLLSASAGVRPVQESRMVYTTK